MGIRSTLASLISAPLAAALEDRIRTLAEEVLEAHDMADPDAVRGLAGRVDATRDGLTSLGKELAQVRETVEAVAADDDGDDDLALKVAGLSAEQDGLSEQVQRLQTELASVSDTLVALTRALDGAETRAAKATTLAKSASKAPSGTSASRSDGDKGCKVDGCGNKHRARGFCGRHYQMWNRGTLPGFVLGDGLVFFEEDGPRWKVEDDGLVGKPATKASRGISVGGKRAKAKKQ